MAKNKKEEPRFDMQVDSYSKDEVDDTDPIFSKAYHKFMVELLSTRDKSVKDELAETVAQMFMDNNKSITSTISQMLTEQNRMVGSVIGEVMVAIENLAVDVKEIKQTVKVHDDKINLEYIQIAKHELRLDKNKEEIAELKTKIDSLSPDVIKQLVDDIEVLKPLIAKFVTYSSRGSTFLRIFGAMIIGWIVTWSVFIFLLRNVWHLIQ